MSLVPPMSGPRLRGLGDPRHRHATLRRDSVDVLPCALAPLSLIDRIGRPDRRVVNDKVRCASECVPAAAFNFTYAVVYHVVIAYR